MGKKSHFSWPLSNEQINGISSFSNDVFQRNADVQKNTECKLHLRTEAIIIIIKSVPGVVRVFFFSLEFIKHKARENPIIVLYLETSSVKKITCVHTVNII